MEKTIAFASTNYGPMWAPVVASWLRVVGYTSRHFETHQLGWLAGAGITDRMYTMSAENKLISEFLNAEKHFTHIFMTESDMVLPHDCIVKLAEMDKDMASGVYFLRSDLPELRGQPCLYKKSFGRPVYSKENPYLHSPVNLFNTNAPFQIDCSGLGCVLIKREVFETLKEPWFDMRAGTKVADDFIGAGFGSDMYFYTHAKRAGFELWCDPTVRCGQVDYYETTFEDYEWQLANNPNFAKSGFIVGADHANDVPSA